MGVDVAKNTMSLKLLCLLKKYQVFQNECLYNSNVYSKAFDVINAKLQCLTSVTRFKG